MQTRITAGRIRMPFSHKFPEATLRSDGVGVIPLCGSSLGLFALIDAEDIELVNSLQRKWRRDTRGYVTARRSTYGAKGKVKPWDIKLHRIVMNAPDGMLVDHVNHDTLDSRKANLRLCTMSQNLANQRKTHGQSRFKGVCPSSIRNKWAAYIKCQSGHFYLGSYVNEVDAAIAYDNAARIHFGQFAKLNFPEGKAA